MHSCILRGCTQPAPRFPNASWENAHKAGEGTQTRHDASYADGWITEISNAAGHPWPEKHWQVIPVSILSLVYWRRGFTFCIPPVNSCLTVIWPSRSVCSAKPMTEACKAILCWHGSHPPVVLWTGFEHPHRINLKNTLITQLSISHLLAVLPISLQLWYFHSTIFLIPVFSVSKEGGYCFMGGCQLDEWYWRYAWNLL